MNDGGLYILPRPTKSEEKTYPPHVIKSKMRQRGTSVEESDVVADTAKRGIPDDTGENIIEKTRTKIQIDIHGTLEDSEWETWESIAAGAKAEKPTRAVGTVSYGCVTHIVGTDVAMWVTNSFAEIKGKAWRAGLMDCKDETASMGGIN